MPYVISFDKWWPDKKPWAISNCLKLWEQNIIVNMLFEAENHENQTFEETILGQN